MKYKITWMSGYTPIEDIVNEFKLINEKYYCKGTFKVMNKDVEFKLEILKKDVLKIEEVK